MTGRVRRSVLRGIPEIDEVDVDCELDEWRPGRRRGRAHVV